MSRKYDIRRQVRETDNTLGGVTITSTAIETRDMELQGLSMQEVLALGGLRIEGQFRGFCHVSTNIIESDIITPDSGVTKYQVTDVDDTYNEHLEFIVKKSE